MTVPSRCARPRGRARCRRGAGAAIQSTAWSVVAVAPGDGWARVFASLGATAIIDGGQSANPSAGEIADALRGTAAAEAIVLTNNPNVRLAALQAAELSPDVDGRGRCNAQPCGGRRRPCWPVGPASA